MPATYYNRTKLKKIYYNGSTLKKMYLNNVLVFIGGELKYYGNATPLSSGRGHLAATTIGDYALFGGGSNSNVVDAYDTSLTRSTPTPLRYARSHLSATTVGDYALFGGGDNSNVVDVYQIL